MQVLLSKGVEESKILFLTLLAAPEGIHNICRRFPRLKLITSEIESGVDEQVLQVVPGINTYSLVLTSQKWCVLMYQCVFLSV